MIVLSNRRLGPAAELLVSPAVATAMLRATASAARPEAASRWEHELVQWLEDRASDPEPAEVEVEAAARTEAPPAAHGVLDVSEIAWTPENFDRQRGFLLRAIAHAAETSEHARALRLWARMIEAHPRDSVQFGRRWISQPRL